MKAEELKPGQAVVWQKNGKYISAIVLKREGERVTIQARYLGDIRNIHISPSELRLATPKEVRTAFVTGSLPQPTPEERLYLLLEEWQGSTPYHRLMLEAIVELSGVCHAQATLQAWMKGETP